MEKRYETATKAKAALDYGLESEKVLAVTCAAAGGYAVDVTTEDGKKLRGKVVDFGVWGVEVKPAGGGLFAWGYGVLVRWEKLVTIERYEPGVEAAVEIVKRRAAEAEARGCPACSSGFPLELERAPCCGRKRRWHGVRCA